MDPLAMSTSSFANPSPSHLTSNPTRGALNTHPHGPWLASKSQRRTLFFFFLNGPSMNGGLWQKDGENGENCLWRAPKKYRSAQRKIRNGTSNIDAKLTFQKIRTKRTCALRNTYLRTFSSAIGQQLRRLHDPLSGQPSMADLKGAGRQSKEHHPPEPWPFFQHTETGDSGCLQRHLLRMSGVTHLINVSSSP